VNIVRGVFRQGKHFIPVLALVIVLFVYFSIAQDNFFTRGNLVNMLTASSVLFIAAMGMTFVLIGGGIDLSQSAIVAVSGILLAKLLDAGVPGGVVVIVVILFAAALGGVINGLLIGLLNLQFFVVTLGSLIALTGAVLLWSQTQTFSVADPVLSKLAVSNLAGIPTPIWIMAATFAVALYIQKRTYFGRDIFAVGGSLQAARLSGIRTSRTIVGIWALSGAAAGLASLLAVGRIGAASPVVDTNLLLMAAAAVLVGGTSLHGGAGGVGGTVCGVLFFAIMQNGLSISGVPGYWQQIATGVILVSAAAGEQVNVRRLSAATRRIVRRFSQDPQRVSEEQVREDFEIHDEQTSSTAVLQLERKPPRDR